VSTEKEIRVQTHLRNEKEDKNKINDFNSSTQCALPRLSSAIATPFCASCFLAWGEKEMSIPPQMCFH
jgi:hypothetical protein